MKRRFTVRGESRSKTQSPLVALLSHQGRPIEKEEQRSCSRSSQNGRTGVVSRALSKSQKPIQPLLGDHPCKKIGFFEVQLSGHLNDHSIENQLVIMDNRVKQRRC